MRRGTSLELRAGLFCAGAAGLLLHLRFLAQGGWRFPVVPPFDVPRLSFVSPAEWRLLSFHALLAVPAVFALLFAVIRPLTATLERALSRYERNDARQMRLVALLFAMILFSFYRIARALCLRDLPITDDEPALEFGARILASGQLTVPVLQPEGAWNDLFLHVRDGRVTSFDWPGGIVFAAAAQLTGLRDHLYAAMAAAGGTAVVASAHRLFGRRWGMLGACAYLASPMAFGMSITSHSHVVSRGFLAVAVWAYVELTAEGARTARRASVLGLGLGGAAGAAFLTRPIESALLLAPVAIHLVVVGIRRKEARPALFAAVALFGVALAAFAAHNHALTHAWWLPARFDRGHTHANVLASMGVGGRVTSHLLHNVALVATYFLGVLGLPLAALGAFEGRWPLRALALGVLASFLLALAHDNVGIHVVGPLHHADAVVPLVLLFVAGCRSLASLARPALRPSQTRMLAMLYAVVAVGGLFTAPFARQLAAHGEHAASAREYLEGRGVENAIVIAPQLAALQTASDVGSWQLDMPHPDPFLSESVLYALPNADPDALHAVHPRRHVYRLLVDPGRGIVGLEHLHVPAGRRVPEGRR